MHDNVNLASSVFGMTRSLNCHPASCRKGNAGAKAKVGLHKWKHKEGHIRTNTVHSAAETQQRQSKKTLK